MSAAMTTADQAGHAAPPPALISAEGTSGRSEFSLDPAKRHINHGSFGAVPSRTLAHQAELKAKLEANPLRWYESLPALHAEQRGRVAGFVGADPDALVFVPNASAAASVVYQSLQLDAGDEVLLTDHIYGAVAMGAERFAARHGAVLRRAAVPHDADAETALTAILVGVTERTRLVIVDQISSATARHFPAQALAEALAHREDVVLLVDGAHAPGILEQAVVSGDRVIWFGNLHKYPCAPRGAAVLTAGAAVAQRLWPLIDSWGANDPYPQRFDQQGALDTTSYLSAHHAISTLDTLFGWQRIRQYSAELAGWAVSLIAPELGELVGADPRVDVGMPLPQQPLLRLPDGVAADPAGARLLKDRLTAEADCEVGVACWQGQGFIRVSAHVYNEPADYEHFVESGLPVIASLRS